MKTYVLTFTKDADTFNLQHQQEAINKHHPGCYFKNVDSYMDYEKVDESIDEAYKCDFDDFVLLSEQNEVDDIQYALREDYGNMFNNIDVMPEQFFRYREAGQVAAAGAAGAGASNGTSAVAANNTAQATTQQTQAVKPTAAPKQPKNLLQTGFKSSVKDVPVHIICINANYPTAANWAKVIENTNKVLSGGKEYYAICWNKFVPGMQFLPALESQTMWTIFPDNTVKEQFKELIGEKNIVVADPLDADSLRTALPSILSTYKNATKVIIHNFKQGTNMTIPVPISTSGTDGSDSSKNPEQAQTTQATSATKNITVEFAEPIASMYDPAENKTIHDILVKIIQCRDSGKSLSKGNASDDKVAKEEAKEVKGKAAKEENDRLNQEQKSGWAAYIEKLISLTVATKQIVDSGKEETKDAPSTLNAFKNLEHEFEEFMMKDIKSFDQSLSNVGLGWISSVRDAAIEAGKEKLKQLGKDKDKKLDKKTKDTIDLLKSDEYIQLKQLLGGSK